MSRFDNLEFDEQESRPEAPQGASLRPGRPGRPATGTPVRDGAYFCAEGDAAYRVDELEAALRSYSRALEQDSTLFDGWLGQLRVLLETGEYSEADLWAGKALELFPEHPELLAAKAVASVRMGKRVLAQAQSDNALTRKGVTGFVWLARAEVLLDADKPMYEHCLAKALETNPERGWMHWDVSRVLRRYGRAAKALNYARIAAQALPAEPGVWLELSRCLLALEMPESKRALEQTLHLKSDCAAARRLLRDYREPGLLRRLQFWRKR